eukprot:899097-Prorocentrum_lima.AAC.1
MMKRLLLQWALAIAANCGLVTKYCPMVFSCQPALLCFPSLPGYLGRMRRSSEPEIGNGALGTYVNLLGSGG